MKGIIFVLFYLVILVPVAAQDFARKQLDKSPRKHEWIKVKASQDREIKCFVAYPEEEENTQALLLIHGKTGLTDWIRSFADQVAAEGYLAIVPDLLSGFSEKYHSTNDFSGPEEIRNAIYRLEGDQVDLDLDSVFNYVQKMPICNGGISVVGFSWGGAQCFRYASRNNKMKTALVFYGTPPKVTYAYKSIEVPVYGFYGGADKSVVATISTAKTIMEGNNKFYEAIVYPSAEHSYMLLGEMRKGGKANKKAKKKSWKRLMAILAGQG